MFALGNLAQVVARAKDNDILDPAILKEACQAAFICMDDANDKVRIYTVCGISFHWSFGL